MAFRHLGQRTWHLWDTWVTRKTVLQIFKASPYFLWVPFPFSSGWKDFLHKWALFPEFSAVGSYHSLQMYIFSLLGLEVGWLWEGKVGTVSKGRMRESKSLLQRLFLRERISRACKGSLGKASKLCRVKKGLDTALLPLPPTPHPPTPRRLWQLRMLIQLRALSALGTDQERGQPCHRVSQGANSEGCQRWKVKHWCQ